MFCSRSLIFSNFSTKWQLSPFVSGFVILRGVFSCLSGRTLCYLPTGSVFFPPKSMAYN